MALLVLLMLALLGTTVARTSLLQMQMAGNDEHRSRARQQAMAAVDSALAAGKGLDLSLPVGYRACSAQVPEQLVCDATDLELPGGLQPESARLGVSVERVAPAAARMPRLGEAGASSTVFYRVAKYEVRGFYDGADLDLGRAEVTQGVLVRMAQ